MLLLKVFLFLSISFSYLSAESDLDIQLLNDHVEKMNSLSAKISELTIKYELALAANANKTCVYYAHDEAINSKNWLMIGQRIGRNHNEFRRSLHEYKSGFGSKETNYWIGLDKLHELTRTGFRTLRIEFAHYPTSNDPNLSPSDLYFYEYSKFRIANMTDNYRLNVGALIRSRTWKNYKGEELLGSNGMEFSALGNPYCSLNLVTDGGWWLSNRQNSCLPVFCPFCKSITSYAPSGYCFWDETRIFIQ